MNDFVPAARFLVVSDIHYQNEHTVQRDYFERALVTAYNYSDNSKNYCKLDALFVVGDFANSGTEVEMQAFNDSLTKIIRPETDVTISVAGHEYSAEGEGAAHEKLKRIFGMEPDVHKVINGFHCISLSTTNGDKFDDDKVLFAENSLTKAANDNAKKPIFFFQHPHLRDTVYGSYVWGNSTLIPTLMNYPQIIDFSGHSHAPINDPRSIHQRHFTSVGTGTMFYFELDEFDKIYGTVPPAQMPTPERLHDAAQMLIVEVNETGCVRILPYDLISEQFFPDSWQIDEPWNPSTFIYTDERFRAAVKPYFTSDDKIDITAITNNSITFSFDQAKIDKEYVNSYDLTVTRKKDGVIVRKISIWSEYYYTDMSSKLSQKIDGLESGGSYILTIRANGFWKNSSIETLIIEFKIRG